MLVGERPIVSRAEGERVRSVVPFKTVDMQDQEQLGIDCRQSPCTERDAWFAENIDKVYPSEYDTDLLVSRPALMPDGTPRECAIAMCGRSSDGDFVESRTCLIKGLGCVYHRCCLDAQVRMISRRTRILVSGGGVAWKSPFTRWRWNGHAVPWLYAWPRRRTLHINLGFDHTRGVAVSPIRLDWCTWFAICVLPTETLSSA